MALATWMIEEVKPGFIRQWYGLRADIPAGWVECDGNNGTRDLRGFYPKGAAAGQEANVTGGNLTHQHVSAGGHAHNAHTVGAKAGTSGSNVSFTAPGTHSTDGAHQHDSLNHEPPFKTTIWIMKT